MCTTCGCGSNEQHDPHHSHDHHHHGHRHEHDHPGNEKGHSGSQLRIQQDILGANNLMAERNRGYFDALNILTINMVSSPGSGKTSILERTVSEAGNDVPIYIVEGDQQSMLDADRIKRTGAPVVQINTGDGCHLDAAMVNKAVASLGVKAGSVLIIENVGNLVCPAMFDLGEEYRVVVFSVTEGDDKPAKYPGMFHTSDICIINKTDLLPYVDFDVAKARELALRLNPDMLFFEVSARTGEGMDAWYQWLKSRKI